MLGVIMDGARREPGLDTFQGRLDHLFQTVRPVGKDRYTVRQVSESIRKNQGVEISAGYISMLCTGERDNPGLQQVEALAKFFGVPPAFLSGHGDTDAVARDLRTLRDAIELKEKLQAADEAMNDPEIRTVALKARGLSADNLKLVNALLDQARKLEGLTQTGDTTAPN
ncbi:helix-turn-helix transcriptional regulator [Polymorphospora sp. NPDC050346]|uniref:helix-turn-helix domain-containing protein n=1 Tax=Polymorphospora sp. NPDC050346 TaxID=3155780 RepID=UPI0033EC0A00